MVDSCQAALTARKDELQLCNLGLAQSQSRSAHLNQEVENKNGQLAAWYRNPMIMLALGILAGVALTR